MPLGFLRDTFARAGDKPALLAGDAAASYAQLLAAWDESLAWLGAQGIRPGEVVALRADYSAAGIALFLALSEQRNVVLHAGRLEGERLHKLLETGEAEALVSCVETGRRAERTGRRAAHPLYQRLRGDGHPGLVLFSSGTTGAPKGAVHDLGRLLGKYRRKRHDLRTLAFLLFDHIGGIDTLFYCLSNASTIVAVDKRDPATVCAAVERHGVQVLPVAPTFLSLLYASGEFRRHDLGSLAYVTYGAEVMPQQTLARCREMFPGAQLVQKYGISEIGTPRSRSKGPDSLWLKLGGEGFAFRVVDGILQVKAESAMLGYLNAPSPFTDDGWFVTGDRVEVDGEYYRILGRESDLINVGGRKVYPAEVESVLRELPDVIEVTVYGEANPLLGQIVAARVWTRPGLDERALGLRLKQHAAARLEPYKVPVKLQFSADDSYASERFKKQRRDGAPG